MSILTSSANVINSWCENKTSAHQQPRPEITPRGREYDPERAERLERGLAILLEHAQGHPDNTWETVAHWQSRMLAFLEHLQEAWRSCGSRPVWQPYEHRLHGMTWQPFPAPCNELAHEECCSYHAERELTKKWRPNFEAHYGNEQLVVLEFVAPGAGPREIRSFVDRLKARRPLQLLLGRTFGVLIPAPQGYAYRVLVRREDLPVLLQAKAVWQEMVPNGSVRLLTVPPEAQALDVAVELRCQAEQALFLLVADGQVPPDQALRWLAEALGADGGKGVKRVVFGPGFQTLSRQAEPALCPGGFSIDEAEDALTGTDSDGAAFSSNRTIDPSLDENEAPELWEPCLVCCDPRCGQRPARDPATGRVRAPLHFTRIKRMVMDDRLVPLSRWGEVVAYIAPEDLVVAAKLLRAAERAAALKALRAARWEVGPRLRAG